MTKTELEKEVQRLKDKCISQLKQIQECNSKDSVINSKVLKLKQQLDNISLIANTFLNVNYPVVEKQTNFGTKYKESKSKDAKLLKEIINISK